MAAGLIIAGTMSSCKKDYTCECTATDTTLNITYTAKMKKKDAQSWCDSWNSSFQVYDGGKCTLK